MNTLTLFYRCVINKAPQKQNSQLWREWKIPQNEGQESQVLNGKEAFELINVFPSLLLSLISLLFWRSGPFWLSLFSLPAFFLFLSWILPWQTSLLPLALLVCGYSTSYSVDLTVSLCCFGCILDPTPSSLPPFVTLEFLQHCFSSPAASVFMNLNNLTFLAKKKKLLMRQHSRVRQSWLPW